MPASAHAVTAGKPTVLISQLPLLMLREMLESSVANFNVGTTRCDLRLLHVTGPHIFNSAAGGRRAQAMQQHDARLVSVQCVILVCELAMKSAGKDLEFVALQQQVILGFWFFIAAATSAAACSLSPRFKLGIACITLRMIVLAFTLTCRNTPRRTSASSMPSQGKTCCSRCRGMRAPSLPTTWRPSCSPPCWREAADET